MPSLALSAEIRLCRLGKALARYSEGNLSSSVIRLGKCQGADAQEQRCCSSQIPKPSPPSIIFPLLTALTNPSTSAATHSKTISSVNSFPANHEAQAALAARSAADLLPTVNAVDQIMCLQLLWRVKSALRKA